MSEAQSRRSFLAKGALLSGGLALGTGLLAGCGDSKPGPALSGGKPQSGGKARIAIIAGAQTGNLDAHKPLGTGSFRGWALYSKLWEWDREAHPGLALAEFAEVNDDASEWTIRLRKGLEFHHGKSIRAEDVIHSLRRLTDPALASPYGYYLPSLRRDAITALDPLTVRIPFEAGHGLAALPELWMSWGGIVPVDYDPVTNPVGAGPYRLKSFTPGQRSTFSKFENYYKADQPYLDEVEIIDFKDPIARLQAMQTGQVDVSPTIAFEQLAFFKSSDRFEVVSSQTDAWHGFAMNLSKAPFDDLRVVKAFRLIADRAELVERVLHGQGRVANDLYAPSDPTYDHEIPQRTRDLSEARSLLRSAGHGGGLAVELVTTAGAGGNAGIVFAQQARGAGVEVKIKLVDDSIFAGPDKNNWTFSTVVGVSRPFLLTLQQHDGPRAAGNKTHFRDAEFTRLVTEAAAQPDVEKRKALVGAAQRIQHDKGGLLIWGFSNNQEAVSRTIGGVTPDRTAFSAWRTDALWRRT
ncbi:ABC transporter substrate-binding protein [Novosphingobium sp. AP12]|uniref:ABC transporter substrate-binding protein n=1 Tax=Novosphingobium sp. AP12 TaxID=1144305 RepID=UPI000271F628|nr:ABC transporter substrate-binding protein [Novosphingobium sp. AP12]EJL28901.1 ABC-type dipeptide transport system, periplasmic component [Novosphingobium sp. AP12]